MLALKLSAFWCTKYYLIVVIEHVLYAVAVVDVPIQDQHPLHPVVLDGVLGSYTNVVKHTEPMRFILSIICLIKLIVLCVKKLPC